MKNFPVFYFSRRAAAIIREIDKIRCFLDNRPAGRYPVIIPKFMQGINNENANKSYDSDFGVSVRLVSDGVQPGDERPRHLQQAVRGRRFQPGREIR